MKRVTALVIAAFLLAASLLTYFGVRRAREGARPAAAAAGGDTDAGMALTLRDRLYCDMSLEEALDVFSTDDDAVNRAVEQVRRKDYEGALATLRGREGGDASSGDLPYWVTTAAAQRGAGRLAEARGAVRRLLTSGEARVRIQAWTLLRELGETPRPEEAREVLGVIVENGMEDGVATVAGYADGVARVFLSDGGGVIGEPLPEPAQDAAKKLVLEGAKVAGGLKPGARRGWPELNTVRLTLLTPSGHLADDEDVDRIDGGRHPLHGVFRAGGVLFGELTKVYTAK